MFQKYLLLFFIFSVFVIPFVQGQYLDDSGCPAFADGDALLCQTEDMCYYENFYFHWKECGTGPETICCGAMSGGFVGILVSIMIAVYILIGLGIFLSFRYCSICHRPPRPYIPEPEPLSPAPISQEF